VGPLQFFGFLLSRLGKTDPLSKRFAIGPVFNYCMIHPLVV
jgi:hypothetical protein